MYKNKLVLGLSFSRMHV